MQSDNSGKYSKGDLSASMIDFFHAGTETTSTTLKWVLLYLALNQVCQNFKKIRSAKKYHHVTAENILKLKCLASDKAFSRKFELQLFFSMNLVDIISCDTSFLIKLNGNVNGTCTIFHLKLRRQSLYYDLCVYLQNDQEACRREINEVLGETRPEVAHMSSLPYTVVMLSLTRLGFFV